MPRRMRLAISPKASRAGVQQSRLIADQWACLIVRVINDVRRFGLTTAPQLATELNRRGIPTLRNGRWHASTVNNLLHRYADVCRTNPKLVTKTLRSPPQALMAYIAAYQIKAIEEQRALRDLP